MTVQQQKLSDASQRVQEDILSRMFRPEAKKLEKLSGRIPRSKESVFGDFPEDFARPSSLSRLGAAMMKSSGSKSTPNLVLHAKAVAVPQKVNSGTGGAARSSAVKNLRQVDEGPGKAGAFKPRIIAPTEFRRVYDRGDLPVKLSHCCGSKLAWKVDVDRLDYHHYLPLFFEGLREKEDPYRFLAIEGVNFLLERGSSRILAVVPQLILPIKAALNTRDTEIIATTVKVLQRLALSGEMIGEALVPYYRQILPIFNLCKGCSKNIGDSIDYGQRRRMNLGELIDETLEILEKSGGEDAFINIKYMIPTYETCFS